MSLQATAAPLVHEEMDIVKSPLTALMKDEVKEVTKQYSDSAVSRVTFQMDRTCFCLGALRHGCWACAVPYTQTDNHVFAHEGVSSAYDNAIKKYNS